MTEIKCQGENCNYEGAFAFRSEKIGGKRLCDNCWGHKYGEETCERCERGCYPEDQGVCGACKIELAEAKS